MNFSLTTSVFHSELSCPQRMILMVLLNHADKQGKAWPSHATIARHAGLTGRAVGINMKSLEQAGWLVRLGHFHRVGVFSVAAPPHTEPASPSMANDVRDAAALTPNQDHLDTEPRSVITEPRSLSLRTPFLQSTQEPPINHPENHPTKAEEGRPPRRDQDLPSPPKQALSKKTDWREWQTQLARQANAVALPQHLPQDFAEAWERYRDYRTQRATEARVASEAVAWTAAAAVASLRSCEEHGKTHGWAAVAAQINLAIGGGWRGLNFQHAAAAATPSRAGASTTRSSGGGPRYPAYQVETATAGYTVAEIMDFMPLERCLPATKQ